MVNPLSAATQGLLSDGSHRPLMNGIQGLLIFAVVSVGSQRGSIDEADQEELRGRSHRRRQQEQMEEDEILMIINAFLKTQ